MWTLLVAVAILANCCCEPLPDANKEFDRLLSLAASGNLTPSANLPDYAPYTRQTLLDKYLQNPEVSFSSQKSTTPSYLNNPVMIIPTVKQEEAGMSKMTLATLVLVSLIVGFLLCVSICFCRK